MNPRIRELSAIAKNLTTDEAIHLGRIHNRTLSLDELGEIHDQKFAELIIRECADITLDYKNHDHYYGWMDHGEEIIRHFGIER